jgi:hypothetical protein
MPTARAGREPQQLGGPVPILAHPLDGSTEAVDSFLVRNCRSTIPIAPCLLTASQQALIGVGMGPRGEVGIGCIHRIQGLLVPQQSAGARTQSNGWAADALHPMLEAPPVRVSVRARRRSVLRAPRTRIQVSQ